MRSRIVLSCLMALGCGDGGDAPADAGVDAPPDAGPGLAEALPPVPEPDGTPRSVFAGAITPAAAAELIPGPARSGLVGDYFMRSARARFVIQAPGRSIGIVPFGGNVVDAATLDGEDELGEIGVVYMLGRTCEHDRVEVLRDGSGGGPAVIRAYGRSAVNDYVNLRAVGLIPVPPAIDPDVGDELLCASTYTLRPDSAALEIAWTFFNPSDLPLQGPFGMLNDAGGDVQVFAPVLGFSHLQGSFESITGGGPSAVPYQVYQGKGVAYGLIPRLAGPAQTSAGLVIAGAAVLVFGAQSFLDVTRRDRDIFMVGPRGAYNGRAELVVARDGAGVEAAYRRGRGDALVTVAGQARFQPSNVPARARVTLFRDVAGNGTLEADDFVVTYLDTDDEGRFSGEIPAGSYLARADVPEVARSAVTVVSFGAGGGPGPSLELPDPARVDFRVVDAEDGSEIPARLTVVGRTPVAPDYRSSQASESRFGVVTTHFAVHGTSLGDPADAPLLLPAGGPYRVYASRGPEWSVASAEIEVAAGDRVVVPLMPLRRVVDTSGYVATALHEHALSSPDSPVSHEDRLASLLVEGIELFAGTDHDRLFDYDPLIDAIGRRELIDAVIGIETTPFAYGHFNAYPLALDENDPTGGAIDWGRIPGTGLAMLPREIFDAMRERGARIVQVNHPRDTGLSFQAYFNRSGMTVDFATRAITGVYANQDVPTEWLRLPLDEPIYADDYDALETWIGFGGSDTDGDGLPEMVALDLVLRDYMNFLSLGKVVTPLGNGDTHTRTLSPAGNPRTLVRVPDDSPAGVAGGVEEDVWQTLSGAAARDVVVTNGPMIRVTRSGSPAIGRVLEATSGEVTFEIVASVAGWADLDTIEVFANATFDRLPSGSSALPPLACATSRTGLSERDPCFGAEPLEVTTVELVGGATRREARWTFTLRADDIPRRAGATGDDAWMVVRARGLRGLFPVLPDGVTSATIDDLIDGDLSVLEGRGVGAMAYTGATFVDFDGGGYRAPFAP
jgi:hypothetical protein